MPPGRKLAVVACMDARVTMEELLGLKIGDAHIIRNAGGTCFSDLEEDVRQQVQKVKSHPWIPENIPVRGFIFDVKTGKLHEVSP